MSRTKGYAAIMIASLIIAVVFTGCEQKKIKEIMADPDHYLNREVGVSGRVVRSFSVLGKGAYEIDDGSGKLWVISSSGVPRTGAEVIVKGRIRDGFDLTGIVKLPDILSSGLVLIESDHKAR